MNNTPNTAKALIFNKNYSNMNHECDRYIYFSDPSNHKKCPGDTCQICFNPNNRIYCGIQTGSLMSLLGIVEKQNWYIIYIKKQHRVFCPSCAKKFKV